MWNNEMDIYHGRSMDDKEKEDFEHCKNSDFKYLIYHTTGENYTFTQESNMNYDNAVSQ